MISAVVLGAITGLTYGLLAVGVVLVYKAGRFINFAHAQLGVLSSLLLAKMVLNWHLNWWIAFALAVCVGAGVGALAERLVIRPLAHRSRTSLLIATIGLSQLVLAFNYFAWLGPNRNALVRLGYPLPFHINAGVSDTFSLLGEHVLILVLVPTVSLTLAAFLKLTFVGKAIRAAACNPDAALMAGISTQALSTLTWGLAGALSAISAILAGPTLGIAALTDPAAAGPGLLLRALGAAALAGFASLTNTMLAGVALGVLEGVVIHQTGDGGAAQLAVFACILLGLLVRSRAILRSNRADLLPFEANERPLNVPDELQAHPVVRHRRGLLVSSALFVAVLLPLLPPFTPPDRQFQLALVVVYAVVGLSVVVLTGWAGQVSLGQFAFVAIGAYVAAQLIQHHWSLPAAAAAAGITCAATAVAVGAVALRLRGVSLAVATLGLAVVTPGWLLHQDWFAPAGALTLPETGVRGALLSSQRSVYYVALLTLACACLAMGSLRRSPAGRVIVATRDNERSTAALGYVPAMTKCAVFGLSGFLAGVGGALWAATQRSISPEQFAAPSSLLILAMVVVGGVGSPAGAILGAVALIGVPMMTAGLLSEVFPSGVQFQLFLAGGGLVAMQLMNPGGLYEALKTSWERVLARFARSLSSTEGEPAAALLVEGVHVHFGGIVAVDDVSIRVEPGEIVGLIGTNGAGKTTLLDAISGLVPIDRGSIRVAGVEMGRLAPEFRAHFGMARSFQDATLFPGLTVVEAVQLVIQRRHRTGMLGGLVGAPWVRRLNATSRTQALELVEKYGLRFWAETPTAELSTGTRRICDLVLQVASRPALLILDEPTAGVAQREAEAFGSIVRQIIDDLGCAALIVEHDMPLMFALADRIYCLETGSVIAEGSPDEIRHNPRVISSYLGHDEVAIQRSTARGADPVRQPRSSGPRSRIPHGERPAPVASRPAPVRAKKSTDPTLARRSSQQ